MVPDMSSLLERAHARAAARRERQVTISLPELDIDLVCDVPTDAIENGQLEAAARKISKGGSSWTIHYSRALVAAKTREIRIGGEVVTVDGEPVVFSDPELWPELDVADAKGAVVALLGLDADILKVAGELMTEAGFVPQDSGDEDPT